MTRPRPSALRVLVLAFLVIGFLAEPGIRAQIEEPPVGLPVGPWILSPAFVAGYSSDSNVFYAAPSLGPVSDRLLASSVAIDATLPFLNSRFDLSYGATKQNYRTVELARSVSQDFVAGVSLLFSSFDRLEAKVERMLGTTDTQSFDPGGETVFRGQPFDLDQQFVGIQRRVPGRRGWDIAATRSALDYAADPELTLYDYDALEFRALYREPVSPNSWLVLDYVERHSDQFEADDTEPDRDVFRKERSRVYRAGMQGFLGRDRNYQILVGFADLRFPGSSGTEYSGVTYEGILDLRLGRAMSFGAAVSRHPWSSFYLDNNYYLAESVSARAERRWLRGSRVGVEASWSRSTYAEPFPEESPYAGVLQEDYTVRYEAYANLMVHDGFGFRASVKDDRRTSNYDLAEYRKRVYFVGILLGWFQ